MATKLTYPKIPIDTGENRAKYWRWNLLQRIRYKTGKHCRTSTTGVTYIYFDEDLSQAEIDIVNQIMSDYETACAPITFAIQNNTYILRDIYEWKDWFEQQIGFNVIITFRSSGQYGGEVLDEIVIQATDPTYQFEKILTNQDKKAITDTLQSMWYWE